MSAATVADLVDMLRRSHFLDAARMEKVSKAQDRFPDALTLAKELVRRGWLTREQALALLKGRPGAPTAAEPIAATNGTVVTSLPPGVPRRRWSGWLLALLALLLLVGAAGVAGWWYQRSTGQPTDPGIQNDLTGFLPSPSVKACSDTSDLKVFDDLEFGPTVRAPFDPTILDALKDKEIPKAEVYPWQPRGLVAVLGEHRMRGSVIAANPDGTLLAVAGQDAFIRIGPIETLHEKAILGGFAVTHTLAWSPRGDILASADGDGAVRLWDVHNLDKVPTPFVLKKGATVTDLSFSHDSKYLLGGGPSGSERGALWLWNVVTHDEVYTKPQSAPVTCVAFSPAPGDYHILWGSGKGDAQLYLGDGEKGEERAHVDCKYSTKKEDERSYVTRVAFSPDGKRAVSGHYDWNLDLGGGDWLVRVWDLDRFELGKEKRVVKGLISDPLVAFGPDNKTVAFTRLTNHRVSLLNTDGADRLRSLAPSSGVYALMFLPRGEQKEDRVAFAGSILTDYNIHIYETGTGKEYRPPVGHLNAVLAVAGSPDGGNLISGGLEGRAWVWDLDKVRPRFQATPGGQVWNVGFHPDGRQVFYCGQATANVPFLDVQTGKASGPTVYDEKHNGAITNAVVTEDGHYVLTGGYSDATVRLWNLMPGPYQGKQVRIFTAAGSGTASVALSPNGKRALQTAGPSLKLLHLRCQEVRREWTGGSWNTFLPNGQVAILGGPTGALWDISEDEPKEAGAIRLALAGAAPGDVGRNGRRLAAVVAGRAAVWDLEPEKPLWEWTPPQHFGGVRAVALSSDGSYLFTANGDGTVYVIQLPQGLKSEFRNSKSK
jgi:WD40 repeat protein